MLGNVLKFGVPVIALLVLITLMVVASQGVSMPVVDTRGIIGDAQRDTLVFAVLIMLIIVIPVFFLLFFIAIRYRDTNKKATYTPDWANNRLLETIWWGVPIAIIVILSVLTWKTSHSLDPYRPLESAKKPLQVQVVALQWKWLFLYPDHDVASVGEFAMPVDTPVEFTITSDAPMNSFWVPQLGGQVYAMAGMSTKLHLSAREPGEYRGSSANISGEGHAGMTLTANAMADNDFTTWVAEAAKSSTALDATSYEALRMPSKGDGVKYYRLTTPGLYDSIVTRYSGAHSMGGHEAKTYEGLY
jgi:cytochrome o ubiquinol oxidase subunit 2